MKGVPKGFKWPSKVDRAEREATIVRLREAGASFRGIGLVVGLSGPRVYAIYQRAVAIAQRNA